MKNTKSPKEEALEEKILRLLEDLHNITPSRDPLPLTLVKELFSSEEVNALHDYANVVSITRLGLNDHGPVHMKTVCLNALKMLKILHEAHITTSLETEGVGTFADSTAAVCLAALLHDVGMTLSRKDHELYSGIIAYTLIRDILHNLLPQAAARRTVIQSVAMEGILGHMTTHPVHSVEAGLILIADGCDMSKGRARIPLEVAKGDIHKYSANAIEKVSILPGSERPIKIDIQMKSEVGFFQVEEVLIPKINSSPAKHLVELYAGVMGEEVKKYL